VVREVSGEGQRRLKRGNERFEKKSERDILSDITKMNLNPYEETWGWNGAEEERFCGNVPKYKGMLQLTCSL